jgi:hypothetical protein
MIVSIDLAERSTSQFVSHLPRLQTIMPMPLSVIILRVSIKRYFGRR